MKNRGNWKQQRTNLKKLNRIKKSSDVIEKITRLSLFTILKSSKEIMVKIEMLGKQ